MQPLKIGFVGAGNMAQALARGFLASGITTPENIMTSSPPIDQQLLNNMAKLGCHTTFNNKEVADFSDVVILSVKPKIIPRVLSEISSLVTPSRPLVSSVALGIQLSQMEQELPMDSRVIRIMPNTPALVNLGASVFSRGTYANEDDAALITRLLSSVGQCDEVPEQYLDAITGLSGAGPAYMYLVIEALADGGVKMGLPRPLSQKLAAQTMMGAAKMVLATGKPPGQLKDEVCSPGGCTIQGVAALENGGLRASMINAVQFATQQSIDTQMFQDDVIKPIQRKQRNIAQNLMQKQNRHM